MLRTELAKSEVKSTREKLLIRIRNSSKILTTSFKISLSLPPPSKVPLQLSPMRLVQTLKLESPMTNPRRINLIERLIQ